MCYETMMGLALPTEPSRTVAEGVPLITCSKAVVGASYPCLLGGLRLRLGRLRFDLSLEGSLLSPGRSRLRLTTAGASGIGSSSLMLVRSTTNAAAVSGSVGVGAGRPGAGS